MKELHNHTDHARCASELASSYPKSATAITSAFLAEIEDSGA